MFSDVLSDGLATVIWSDITFFGHTYPAHPGFEEIHLRLGF